VSTAAATVKWLYPGMRVKRWILLAIFGIAIGFLGFAFFNHAQPVDALTLANRIVRWIAAKWQMRVEDHPAATWLGVGLMVVAGGIVLYSFSRLTHSLTSALNPAGGDTRLVDVVHRNRVLAQGPRVVVLGGGTGLSTMLRGLKQYTSNITAVVTVSDDGGSSGKLRNQLNMLPPGDIRNCLVSLADSEATMTDLFQYRFRANTAEGLRDHAFGNLLIAAMCEISGGDFEQAVRLSSRVLNIRGRVLPSTLTHVTLRAQMEDGSVVDGETSIAHSDKRIRRVMLCPDEAEPLEEVLEHIRAADIIVIGPGSVFTSVLPNLLVPGIQEALRSTRARKIYVCNVMTQPGETDGFSASEHVKAIDTHLKRPVFDYVLVNTEVPSLEVLNKYRKSGSVRVEPDTDRIRALGYRPIKGNFISQTDVVRHDSARLAEAIMKLIGY